MFFRRLWNFLGGKNLAMDLGTANSLIYCPGEGIVLNEPSVVAVDVTCDKIIAVGTEAKRYLGRAPERIRVIRPMRDGVIADFETTTLMISSFIERVCRGLRLIRPRLIVCVPLGVTQVEKRAVIEAGQRGGARDVRLIEEPLAVAVGADLPFDKPLGNMNALENTPPELAADIFDQGLLMAGGGALLKGLDQLIHRETGLRAIVDIDPLTAVVRGTGKVLERGKAYEATLLD